MWFSSHVIAVSTGLTASTDAQEAASLWARSLAGIWELQVCLLGVHDSICSEASSRRFIPDAGLSKTGVDSASITSAACRRRSTPDSGSDCGSFTVPEELRRPVPDTGQLGDGYRNGRFLSAMGVSIDK